MTPLHTGPGTTTLQRGIPAAAQPGANVPLPRTLAELDRARLAGDREFLDYFEGRRGTPPGSHRERLLNFN